MKKLVLFSVFLGLVASGDAYSAARSSRGRTAPAATNAASSGGTTAARAAVSARAATTAPKAAAPVTAARAATTGRTTVGRASAPAAGTGTVAARAATKKSVMSSGTKVTAATKNTVVSEECQMKFEGCMDSFCMLDNETGGRCICSDKNSEFDAILTEIENLDRQSYAMATTGVERIEMGDQASEVIANANAVANSVIESTRVEEVKREEKRKELDLSLWDVNFEDVEEDIFEEDTGKVKVQLISDKTGDALFDAASELCRERVPECTADFSLLHMMYSQKIRSDCTAYENSLKQKKNASAQKLTAAEKALRTAALEQLKTANKYDLGQCTVEFKKCMVTTGGCGDDFSKCASVAASDNTNVQQSTTRKPKNYKIQGAVSNIEISASTYDTLVAKKPLCESVTKSCVAVADKVWDTFLREVAPQIKSAELVAEDNIRQNCVGSISSCFQKACKENIDPNDKDGSYDMCLTRPATMLNLCKVPLNACGIDASSESAAEKSAIWEFVLARLASMRVDSCTTAVKECLQSEDRCGDDYTQCIGLDTDSIVRMCPYDKLVGCQKVHGTEKVTSDAVYDEIARMVQGIFLNIDNNFLEYCQNAANEAMVNICGDTENCDGITLDDGVGTRSLEYKICEYSMKEPEETTEEGTVSDLEKQLAKISYNSSACMASANAVSDADLRNKRKLGGVLSGIIFWENVEANDEGVLMGPDTTAATDSEEPVLTGVDKYLADAGVTVTDKEYQLLKSELGGLQNNINTAIQMIEADPDVQFCMTGREVQGMKRSGKDARDRIGSKDKDAARFPGLTKQMRLKIANSAIAQARDNYYEAYDKYTKTMAEDFAALTERVAKLSNEDALNRRRHNGRPECIAMPQRRLLGWATPAKISLVQSDVSTSTAESGFQGATMIVPYVGSNSLMTTAQLNQSTEGLQMQSAANYEDRNRKTNIQAVFNWDTATCSLCTTISQCTKIKKKFLGGRYCASWTAPQERCETIQF